MPPHKFIATFEDWIYNIMHDMRNESNFLTGSIVPPDSAMGSSNVIFKSALQKFFRQHLFFIKCVKPRDTSQTNGRPMGTIFALCIQLKMDMILSNTPDVKETFSSVKKTFLSCFTYLNASKASS